METFNNRLCYVILFENHQHGGTHGMTNRLRGYTRQKRLGNTGLGYPLITYFSRESLPRKECCIFLPFNWFKKALHRKTNRQSSIGINFITFIKVNKVIVPNTDPQKILVD